MNAIIRRETDEGVEMKMIKDVGIVKTYKTYGQNGKHEYMELWTHSMYPTEKIVFDGKTQIIFEGSEQWIS